MKIENEKEYRLKNGGVVLVIRRSANGWLLTKPLLNDVEWPENYRWIKTTDILRENEGDEMKYPFDDDRVPHAVNNREMEVGKFYRCERAPQSVKFTEGKIYMCIKVDGGPTWSPTNLTWCPALWSTTSSRSTRDGQKRVGTSPRSRPAGGTPLREILGD